MWGGRTGGTLQTWGCCHGSSDFGTTTLIFLSFCTLFWFIDLDSLSNLFLLRRQGALGLENPSKFNVGCAQKSLRTTALTNSVPLLWNLSDHKQRGSTSQYRHHVINSVHGGVKTHPVIISSPQALSGDNPATQNPFFTLNGLMNSIHTRDVNLSSDPDSIKIRVWLRKWSGSSTKRKVPPPPVPVPPSSGVLIKVSRGQRLLQSIDAPSECVCEHGVCKWDFYFLVINVLLLTHTHTHKKEFRSNLLAVFMKHNTKWNKGAYGPAREQ